FKFSTVHWRNRTRRFFRRPYACGGKRRGRKRVALVRSAEASTAGNRASQTKAAFLQPGADISKELSSVSGRGVLRSFRGHGSSVGASPSRCRNHGASAN